MTTITAITDSGGNHSWMLNSLRESLLGDIIESYSIDTSRVRKSGGYHLNPVVKVGIINNRDLTSCHKNIFPELDHEDTDKHKLRDN